MLTTGRFSATETLRILQGKPDGGGGGRQRASLHKGALKPGAEQRGKSLVPPGPGSGEGPAAPLYPLPPTLPGPSPFHGAAHSALQLGHFSGLQFDPKGREESICAENWNESDFN